MDLMAVGGLLFLVCVILWVASLFTSDPARAKKLLLWAIALQMTSCGLCFKASGDKSASDKASSKSDGIHRQLNGSIPGFNACLGDGGEFMTCRFTVGGNYSAHGKTVMGKPKNSGPPECEKWH